MIGRGERVGYGGKRNVVRLERKKSREVQERRERGSLQNINVHTIRIQSTPTFNHGKTRGHLTTNERIIHKQNEHKINRFIYNDKLSLT